MATIVRELSRNDDTGLCQFEIIQIIRGGHEEAISSFGRILLKNYPGDDYSKIGSLFANFSSRVRAYSDAELFVASEILRHSGAGPIVEQGQVYLLRDEKWYINFDQQFIPLTKTLVERCDI